MMICSTLLEISTSAEVAPAPTAAGTIAFDELILPQNAVGLPALTRDAIGT